MPGIDSYTKLMLHMNSGFNDSSDSGHSPVVVGPTIDTGTKKFGAGAGKFVGASSQYIYYPDSSDWYFANADFTIDAWIYINSFGAHSDPLIAHQGVDNNNYWVFQLHGASLGLRFYNLVGGVVKHDLNQGSIAGWNTGQWYHVALVRYGDNWKLYRTGISLAGMTNSNAMPDFNSPLYLSTWFGLATTNNFLDGWLDEYRVSKGIARWTSNFTPPTSEYTGNGVSNTIISRRRIEGE